MSMDERVIALTDLTKQYGRFTAVDRICLTIRKGEIFGLLGPNGAGKSTTILMMLGLTEPTFGSVEICGIDSTRHPIEVKRKIGYLPEDVGFYDDMTGPENLIYTARLNGISDAEAKGAGADGACGACRTDEKEDREIFARYAPAIGAGRRAYQKSGNYNPG